MPKVVTTKQSAAIDKLDGKKRRFVDLFDQLFGHITNTCQAVGISRQTYYDWLEKDPDFATAILESEAHLNDEIRQVLIEKAASGDMTAVIFYLKNRHPDFKQKPGFMQQINVDGDKGNQITFVNFDHEPESK